MLWTAYVPQQGALRKGVKPELIANSNGDQELVTITTKARRSGVTHVCKPSYLDTCAIGMRKENRLAILSCSCPEANSLPSRMKIETERRLPKRIVQLSLAHYPPSLPVADIHGHKIRV